MNAIKKMVSFFWNRSLMIFLIIGGLNTIVSMSLNYALNTWAAWPFFYSSAFAFAVCSVPSFYFNRKYSFQSTAPLLKSIVKFTTIITTCFLLSYALNHLAMPFLREEFLQSWPQSIYTFIRVVGLQVVFTALNYVGQRLWAFKE